MSVRSQLGAFRRQVLNTVYQRPVPLRADAAVVSFSFDDFPRSALTTGAPILENYGARATYYVAMSLMGTRNELGEQFREEDLWTARDRGHEIASHTFGHVSARQVSYDRFKQDVDRGERAISEKMGVPPSGNFAFPYGHVTLAVKRNLSPSLRSCRGTAGGLNGPDVDLNLLRANRLYGDVDQADAARQMILENRKRGHWLIFYSHDVAANPSRFGCTPGLLEEVCSFAAAQGARFRTVAQVMAELGQQEARSGVHRMPGGCSREPCEVESNA